MLPAPASSASGRPSSLRSRASDSAHARTARSDLLLRQRAQFSKRCSLPLVGLGFTPVRAVTLALSGHAAGVSFGAVGTPVLPQMATTGFSGLELARPAGLLHSGHGAILVAFLVRPAGDAPPRPREWIYGALAAFLFFVPCCGRHLHERPLAPLLGKSVSGRGRYPRPHRPSGGAEPATAALTGRRSGGSLKWKDQSTG